MKVRTSKYNLARALDALGLLRLGAAVQSGMLARSLRILYLHDVPDAQVDRFDRLLGYLRRRYVPATRADLEQLVDAGRWPYAKSGVLLTFDDGLRSHYQTVAPCLEKHGFRGWFFVPTGMVLTPPSAQPAAAIRQRVLHGQDTSVDPRVFMTRDEVRDLARRHEVGCHTASHVRLSAQLSEARLRGEILDSRRELEDIVEKAVDSFSWVGGEEFAYCPAAARLIASSYRFCFTTNTRLIWPGSNPLALDRTHLEAEFADALVRFQLSGLMDLWYATKRWRVARTLAAASPIMEGAGR